MQNIPFLWTPILHMLSPKSLKLHQPIFYSINNFSVYTYNSLRRLKWWLFLPPRVWCWASLHGCYLSVSSSYYRLYLHVTNRHRQQVRINFVTYIYYYERYKVHTIVNSIFIIKRKFLVNVIGFLCRSEILDHNWSWTKFKI